MAKETKQEPLEKQLWKAGYKLRKNIDAAEYKHVVLGLIFLKYISEAFEGHYSKLSAGQGEYASLQILKIKTNTRLKTFSLCRLLHAGASYKIKQHSQLLAE
jgi:type I restriction-modification system DNA methylase subunit